MAGAGQPFYMPLTWPVGHLASAISRSPKEAKPPVPTATADLDVIGHLTACFGALRSLLVALLCIYVLYEGEQYPAFGAGAVLSWSWIQPIVVRNLVGTWVICGFWDWFLNFSPLSGKLAKFKLNPTRPSKSQLVHDALMTTSASLTAAAIEVFCCHMWASGAFPFDRRLSDRPLVSAVAALTMTHWRIPHFWLIHRAMHPWRISWLPDVGRLLYRHVHSLHHKSYNPTAFSGTSMHPIESTAYYSACLLAVPFGVHPAIVLGCIVDCGMGAWLGHDGFQWPGSGDYFHQLHHAHFDCNYGAMHVPIDKWLGTYAGSKADLKRIWTRPEEKVGREGNDTPVHAAG